MKRMKTLTLVVALTTATGFAFGQDANPLTISGSVRPQTQYNLSDGTGWANLSSGPGGQSYIKFADKLSKYSSLVLKFGTPYLDDKSGSTYDSTKGTDSAGSAINGWISGVGIQEAYGSTDILGELGANDLIGLKLQAGMFKLKAPTFNRGMNFGLGTGDEGSRSEVYDLYTVSIPGNSYESYKWSVEVPFNVLKDVFPLNLKVGSDLDLTGKGERTGLTAYAEASGRNLYLLDDKFVVDWAVYYTYKGRDAAPVGTPYVDNGKVFGGLVDLGFGFENGLSFGFGAAADLAAYSYKAAWNGSLGTLSSYDESNLNWQVGMDVTAKDLVKVYGAMIHRNYFNIGQIDSTGAYVALSSTAAENYSQDYAAFRLNLLPVKGLTPYFGGTYVLGYTFVKDTKTKKNRGDGTTDDVLKNSTPLSWESGITWNVTNFFTLDAGYTRGANNALATFGAVINAIKQSDQGAIFARAGWKF